MMKINFDLKKKASNAKVMIRFGISRTSFYYER